jgi:NHLM bacteriocin system ABC transporter ATP-binding protein
MTATWDELIGMEGQRLVSSNRAPLTLDDEDTAWLVRSGAADLFFVKAEGGQPVGMRQHLFRVDAGGIMFGIQASNQGYVMVAVGTPDTILIRLPRASLQDRASDCGNDELISPAVEGWVEHLSAALTRNIYPRPTIDLMLQQGGLATPDCSLTLSANRGMLWLAGIPGGSLYIGLEMLQEGQSLFPLSSQAWIQPGASVPLKAFVTGEVVARPELWEGLRAFHRVFVSCLIANTSLEKVDEFLKVRDTAAYRDQAYGKALRALAGVMDSTPEEPDAGADDDPLVAACRLVAAAAKIPLNPPASYKSEKYRDPLRVLLHAARIRARSVSLGDDWWHEDAGPLLAFTFGENAPVALLPVSPGKYKMVDPKTRAIIPVDRQTAKGIADRAYAFYRPFPDQGLTFREMLAFGFASSHRDILTIVLTGLAASGLTFLVPVFTGIIFDTVIPASQYQVLYQMLAALLVSGVAIGIFQMTRGISLLRIETRADLSLQGALWDRLLKLPANFFRRFNTGELAARANGIDNIQVILAGPAVTVILSAVFSLPSLGLLFYYSVPMALWTLLVLLACGLFMVIHGRFALKAYRKVQQTYQKVGGTVFQLLTGISKLRSSGAEGGAFALWANQFRDMRLSLFLWRRLNNYGAVFYTVLPLLSLTLAYYQASLVADGPGFSTGAFLAFVSVFSTIIASTVSIGMAYPSLLNMVPIYENLKPILQAIPEVDRQKSISNELKGGIEINRVSFSYQSDVAPVLKNITIRIAPGEHVALVGPSGSGKSTILRLLLGFEKPDSGTIYFDGQDLSKLDITSVRRQIGTVLQNGRLLTGTVYDNIAGSFSELTEKDAWEAARLVGLEDEIRQMPMGMHTCVSEGGGTFSGGQRQRLMLARALIRRPRLIFIDEATSFLDNPTQEIFSRSLEGLKITRVVIAHRLSTIVNADTIYVIKDGIVAESGSYRELMGKNGAFADLVRRQIE